MWSGSQLNMSGCENTLNSRRETGWLGHFDCQYEGSGLGRLKRIETRSSKQEGTRPEEPEAFVTYAEHTIEEQIICWDVWHETQIIRNHGTERQTGHGHQLSVERILGSSNGAGGVSCRQTVEPRWPSLP